MKVEVNKTAILDSIEDNIEDFVQPLSTIFIETGWDDVMVNKLSRSSNFVEELAALLVEKNIHKEVASCVEELLEDENY